MKKALDFELSGSVWCKAEDYEWKSYNGVEYICPVGDFTEYNPFDDPIKLFNDFKELIDSIWKFREKPGSGSKCKLKKTYKNFAKKWGLLGVGFSRIIDISLVMPYDDNNTEINYVNIQRILLRESYKYSTEDYEMTKLEKGELLSICPDGLPAAAADVTIAEFSSSYGGIKRQEYRESLYSLACCPDILRIKDAMNDEKTDFFFFPSCVSIHEKTMSWKYHCLLQAVSIIYAISRTETLKPWAMCPNCGRLFDNRDNPRRVYCNESCKAATNKRTQRAHMRERGDAENG